MSKDSELRRAQQKKAALLRAAFNARVALQRIDYNIDVIEPAKDQIELDAPTKGLPEFEVEDD